MKTHEEIKHSLQACKLDIPCSDDCIYRMIGCSNAFNADALAYINQLENQSGKTAEMITPAEPAPTWISVNEQLPENEKTVLAYAVTRETGRSIRGHVVQAFYTDGRCYAEDSAYEWDTDYSCDHMIYDPDNDKYRVPVGWWESVRYSDVFSAIDDFVTHWMPLPEPPCEENGATD